MECQSFDDNDEDDDDDDDDNDEEYPSIYSDTFFPFFSIRTVLYIILNVKLHLCGEAQNAMFKDTAQVEVEKGTFETSVQSSIQSFFQVLL